MDGHFLNPLFSPESILVLSDAQSTDDRGHVSANAQWPKWKDLGFWGPIQALQLDAPPDSTLLKRTDPIDLAVIDCLPDQTLRALDLAQALRCKTVLKWPRSASDPDALRRMQQTRERGMRWLDASRFGFQRPAWGLNLSTVQAQSLPGTLALVCQSADLLVSMLDWARFNEIGLSMAICPDARDGVDLPELLDFLANDSSTHSILLCIDGVSDARRFMSALRAAAIAKPVIAMKSARGSTGMALAQSHPTTWTGQDDVFEAAFRRAGVVRVRTFTQLFSVARCLGSRFKPGGTRLAVAGNGIGLAMVAVDRAEDLGVTVQPLKESLRTELMPQLAPMSRLEPVADLTSHWNAEQIRAYIRMADRDPDVDGILLLHAPCPGSDGEAVAQGVIQAYPALHKPLLTCWMGDETVRPARKALNSAHIPTFRTPEAAVEAFAHVTQYHQNQRLLQQTPAPLSDLGKPDLEGARVLIEGIRAEGRFTLTEMESKALLAAFHVPVTRTMLARTASEAMLIANQLGYPVAMKIDSPDIDHKSDVDGVALDIGHATRVRDLYQVMLSRVRQAQPQARVQGVTLQPMCVKPRGRELCIGVRRDPLFGPVITFGAGGRMVELLADQAMALPPLNPFLALRLIERARVHQVLGEWHGAPPADVAAVERLLLRVSEMACELPQIESLEINPVIVDHRGAMAVDARITLRDVDAHARPYHHLAVLPYPSRCEREWPLKRGGFYTVRPIRPDDAEMLQSFVRGLSPQSRYFRFASALLELPARMLARYTLIDYDREMALVAEHRERIPDGDGGYTERARIIGVSRYITNPDQESCEFSLVVNDGFAGQGLGSRLMLSIMELARDAGLERIEGLVLGHNTGMLRLMQGLGYEVRPCLEDPEFRLVVRKLR